MAIRFILTFLLIFSFTVEAKKKRKTKKKNSNVVRVAAKLHKQGQYTRSNKLLSRKYNLRKLKSTPATVYYIYAQNLFKLGQHAKSINYFNLMIKKKYLRAHVKTIRAYKKDEVDEDNVPKVLRKAYFHMGMSYNALYKKKKATTYLKKAKRYLKICDDVDYSDRCGEILEQLDEAEKIKELEKTYYQFFVYAGRLLYQNTVYLVNSTTKEEIEILSNDASLCYGGGLRLTNAFSGYELSGCLFSGNSTVKSQGGSKDYKQSGVPLVGFLTELGYFWKPDNDKTRLGLSGSLFYKSGLYSEPDDWKVKNNKSTSIGYVLTVGHELSLFELLLKLGKYGNTNMFSINTAINF